MALTSGTLIGRYEIQRRLGRGGMGTLYLAQDPVLARPVALKLFHADLDSEDYRERFAREARAVAALNHPNIVTIHDYGEFEAQPYIVMEFIEGRTLAQVIQAQADVSLVEKLRWIEELCAGVGFVHRAGIIHRDIKPSNVMLDLSGRLKVLDFGIARVGASFSSSSTGPLGSPGYMAPEQVSGGALDHRADIFSIGVVCYELLTYVQAFKGEPVAQVHQIMTVEPTVVHDVVTGIPIELSIAVARAMAKDPMARFADTDSLAATAAAVRRRLELEPEMMPTVIITRPAVARMADPGTWTGRSDSVAIGDAPSQPTPKPLTPWADREMLTRRRHQQIEGALQEARACVERQQLDEAKEACERALTIDETHADGLALYESIKNAVARRDAIGLLAEARRELANGALATSAELLQRARGLCPDVPDATRLERDLRLARVEADRIRKRGEALEGALRSAQEAIERWDLDNALMHAREALDIEPGNGRARELESEVMRQLDQDVGVPGLQTTVIVPRSPAASMPTAIDPLDVIGRTEAVPAAMPVQPPTPAGVRSAPRQGGAKRTAAPLIAKVRSLRPAATLSTQLAPLRARWQKLAPRDRAIGAAVCAVVLLGIAGLAWFTSMPSTAPVLSTLVIDAAPWARVSAVRGEDGQAVPIPASAATPLSLDLPLGVYRISLVGPPPTEDAREIEVRVEAGRVIVAPLQQFPVVTAEQYFERYISSGEPAEGAAP